ncbi:MAG: nuclear transport factor 2 family protein [Acidobacteriota bacterium]
MSMNRRALLTVAAGAALPLAGLARESGTAAGEEVSGLLLAQTSEMMDAIASGKAAVWEKYLHPRAVTTSEDGEVLDRAKLLESLNPLPAGISGSIRVVDFRARVEGSVAVATYVSEESESYHGQKLHCRYRSTDTWVKTPRGWRVLSSQVLALREDPPAVELPEPSLAEYAGIYELTPEIRYEIRRTGASLEGQQTGRPAKSLRAEVHDVLFVPGNPRYRYVMLRDPAGKIRGFAQRREAWDIVWTRRAQVSPGSGSPPRAAPSNNSSAALSVDKRSEKKPSGQGGFFCLTPRPGWWVRLSGKRAEKCEYLVR